MDNFPYITILTSLNGSQGDNNYQKEGVVIKRFVLLSIVFILYFGVAGWIEAKTTTGHIVRTPEVDKMKRDDRKKPHFENCLFMAEPHKTKCLNVRALLLAFEW